MATEWESFPVKEIKHKEGMPFMILVAEDPADPSRQIHVRMPSQPIQTVETATPDN